MLSSVTLVFFSFIQREAVRLHLIQAAAALPVPPPAVPLIPVQNPTLDCRLFIPDFVTNGIKCVYFFIFAIGKLNSPGTCLFSSFAFLTLSINCFIVPSRYKFASNKSLIIIRIIIIYF